MRGDVGLDELRAQLADVDLNEYVAGFRKWALARANADTVDKYVRQLRVLIPEGTPFMRSAFVSTKVSSVLYALDVSSTTQRRYAAAWSRFGKCLVEKGVIPKNPLEAVQKPRNNKVPEKWLELVDVKRYVAAQPARYQALAALREGAGVEISAGLSVRVRDVYIDRHVVHVHGTKNDRRDRLVLVEDWA